MTRVDFYILQDLDLTARARFACRLACRAMAGGHPVHLHTTDAAADRELDELLWRYPEGRFIPHSVLDAQGASGSRAPVTIGSCAPREREGLLINLSEGMPAFFAGFDRVAEIVVEANRAAGRAHYKAYRDRGYPLFHHDLEEWENQ